MMQADLVRVLGATPTLPRFTRRAWAVSHRLFSCTLLLAYSVFLARALPRSVLALVAFLCASIKTIIFLSFSPAALSPLAGGPRTRHQAHRDRGSALRLDLQQTTNHQPRFPSVVYDAWIHYHGHKLPFEPLPYS
ncbi:hypothetical protein BDV06DRAFT_129542 [Aspergillus oleicola]